MTENIVTPLILHDGYEVETVFYGSGTLCISTQAGCRMACPFCASGRAGLMRNLSLKEMSAQIDLHEDAEIERLTLSGIGEPLDNLDVVSEFISNAELPVSVTTSVPDAKLLPRLIDTDHNGVMLSLHAGLEKTHKKKLVPKSDSLDNIFCSLNKTWNTLSKNRRRKIGFNYLLFKGVNDTEAEIEAFIDIVAEYDGATIHLLYCNPVEKSNFKSPSDEDRDKVYNMLVEAGLNVRRANRWRKSKKKAAAVHFF